jgi:hypothetical protein
MDAQMLINIFLKISYAVIILLKLGLNLNLD